MSNVGRMQSASFAGMCRAVSSKILDEGKAYRACDIDVMSHNGFNFPGYPGGLMYWANTIGVGDRSLLPDPGLAPATASVAPPPVSCPGWPKPAPRSATPNLLPGVAAARAGQTLHRPGRMMACSGSR